MKNKILILIFIIINLQSKAQIANSAGDNTPLIKSKDSISTHIIVSLMVKLNGDTVKSDKIKFSIYDPTDSSLYFIRIPSEYVFQLEKGDLEYLVTVSHEGHQTKSFIVNANCPMEKEFFLQFKINLLNIEDESVLGILEYDSKEADFIKRPFDR